MASITSLMNSSTSSTSSLYGNRNVISGLASGMDTEAMIENSVSGYKSKITSLQQQMTKLQWKQDAYRSLISQMNNILNKYASFTSSTNLMSSSFFSKAVNAVANGANASKVSVTGKGTSNVQIDRIKQLAQAATYTVDAKGLASKGAATEAIKWDDPIETSNVSGSMTLLVGGMADSSKATRLNIRFSESQVFQNADEMAAAINEQLSKQQIGSSPASDKIEAVAVDGVISFQEKGTGNGLRISSASGGLKELFGSTDADGNTTFNLDSRPTGEGTDEVPLINRQDRAEYLKEQSVNITLDGKTKSIKLGDIINDDFMALSADEKSKKLAEGLQGKINEAFGSGKVTVGTNADGSLRFESLKEGSVLKVGGNAAVNESMGLGAGGYSNVLQNGWTLERVLGADKFQPKQAVDEDGNVIAGKYLNAKGEEVDDPAEAMQVATLTINGQEIELSKDDTIQNMMDKVNSSDAGVDIKYSSLTGEFSITAKETGADSKIEIEGDLGSALFGMAKKIDEKTTFNDVFGANLAPGESRYIRINYQYPGAIWPSSSIFSITADTTVDDVLKHLNDDVAKYGETVTFDKETGQFKYTHSTGLEATASIRIDVPGGTSEILTAGKEYLETKGTYTAGQDAEFTVTVNGKQMDLTRSSNNVDLDGYNVTLKGAFGYNADGTEDVSAEAITFQTNTDTDKIVDAIKSFVNDYNEMVKALHSAYTTEPLKNSKKEDYKPLTDEDRKTMSESAIKTYEEQAKTGLLYADSDLSMLYSKLTSAIQGGVNGPAMRSIGLNITYEDRLTTINLDEEALRNALESDPDKVKDVFTKTVSGGADSEGLMSNLRSTLQQYASTSIGSPGILVNKAGSTLSSYSLNNNELNDQITNLQEQVEKWQTRMSDRVDFYTNQFTRLEMLINQMNSQSSMLAGLTGGM